jgi:hypothetical protein
MLLGGNSLTLSVPTYGYEECARPSNADFDLVHNQITGGHLTKVGDPARRGREIIVKREMKEKRVMAKRTVILQLQRNPWLFG